MASAPAGSNAAIHVRDLGAIAIERNAETTVLRGKAELAMSLLISRFPHEVPRQTIFDVLWGHDAAGDLANNLRVLVHRIRQALGSAESLLFANEAYRLTIMPTQLDSVVFERLIEQANNHLADGQAGQARDVLDTALSLWRGTTAGGEPHDELRSWQTRLQTRRLDAEEDRIQALLDSGDETVAAVDTQVLVHEQPYRERRWELLMLALYRSGRQSDALDAAATATQQLQTELGITPRPSLRQLELDILQQAPHLDRSSSRTRELPLLPAVVSGGMLGRSEEAALAKALLDEHQIVTVTGPGGIGKTTLALTLAHERAVGSTEVWWCDLSSIRASSTSGTGPADRDRSELALRVGVAAGVRNGTDSCAEVAKILSHRSDVLLVLDTCEQVVDDARYLIETLRSASNITVLATSRRPLDLSSEAVVPLGPLQTDAAAAKLFERIASAAAPTAPLDDVERIRAICDRLDGMPLAIELVARRVRSFSLPEIDDRLEALLHDVDLRPTTTERHATMTTALAWSTDQLTPDARTALGAASVFLGSFDLTAFEALAGDPSRNPLRALEELVDHGLVQVIRTVERSRYRLLQPIRRHASQHLAEHIEADRDRHLEHYLDRLEAAYTLQSSTSSQALTNLILHELDNYAAVHEWALASGRLDDDMRLYRPLNVAHLHDRPEPFLWARETVEQPAAADCDRYGDALHAAWYGALAVQLDIEGAAALAERLRNDALGASHDLAQLALGLHELLVHHDYDRAEAHFASASQDDPYVRYVATSVGASVRLTQANRQGTNATAAAEHASASIEASLQWARSIGAENFEVGLLEQQAQVQIGAGQLDLARELANEAQTRADTLAMGHVQAQAEFQLVRCDVLQARHGPDVARRLADALDRAVRASAQARLRWQLPLAAEILAANGHRDVAALCLTVSGFAPETGRTVADITAKEMAAGVELARGRNLLDVAVLVSPLLQDPRS